MTSIRIKFLTLVLSCILLCSGIIGGVSIFNAQSAIDGNSAQIMNLLCSDKTQNIDLSLASIEQSVNTLAIHTQNQLDDISRFKTDSRYVEEYTNKIKPYTMNTANNTDGVFAVYVRFNPKITSPTAGVLFQIDTVTKSMVEIVPTDISLYDSNDIERVGWYYEPIANKKATWMDPYYNKNLSTWIVSFVVPIYIDDVTIGVVGMDISFDLLKDIVNSTSIYESGYAFLCSENGKIIYHKQLPMDTAMLGVDKDLEKLVMQLSDQSSGTDVFSYTYYDQGRMAAFRTLKNGMKFVLTAPRQEINATRNYLTFQIIIVSLFIVLLAIILTLIYTRKLVNPIEELNKAAKQVAEGNLSVTINHHSKDEIGTLTDSFRKTVAHLKEYIDYINGLAYRDSLTGVKNKTAYQENLVHTDELTSQQRPQFGIVVLDINGLKNINDTYGHDVGDTLIVSSSHIICDTFKMSCVYRIGGDEFAVHLENDDLKQYENLLDLLQQNMDNHNKSASIENKISIAYGAAIYDYKIDTCYQDVFRRADTAMYECKIHSRKSDAPNQ